MNEMNRASVDEHATGFEVLLKFCLGDGREIVSFLGWFREAPESAIGDGIDGLMVCESERFF